MYGATHNHATQGFVVKKSRSRRWGRRLRARTARKHLFFEMLERRDLLANGVLQGVAFVDSNGNDTLDAGEPLKEGATIELYQSPDWVTPVATATTDANGEYLFDFGVLGLPGGTYRLKEIPPPGYAADGTQIISPTNPASQIAPDTIQVTVIDPAWVYYASRATSLPEILITDQVYGASPTTTTATQFNIRVDQTPTMASPYFLTLCMDRQSAVSAGNIFQVYQEPLPPNSFVVNDVNGGRIAYLYNRYGTTLRTQMEIAGLQVALWELVYDASPDLDSGNYQFTSATQVGFNVTNSVRAQANSYLAEAASKSGRAILLDSTLDGTEPLKTGRQSMLAPQSLNFANAPSTPVIVLGPDKNPGTPQVVKVVNAETGVVLFQFPAYEEDYVGGARVALADVNGDGKKEIVTAPGRNRPPEIRVFSLEGDPITSFMAYDPSYRGGVQLTVTDVNGDGKMDIITVPSYGVSEVRVFLNQQPDSPPFRDNEPDISFVAFPVATMFGAVVAAGDMGSWDNGSFVNVLDKKPEIVVATAGGVKAAVSVFEVTGATPARVQSLFPFTEVNPNYLGGVSLDVAWIDQGADPDQDPPDIIAGMGVNGTSRIEVWRWNTSDATLSLRGVIPDAFTGSSNNAPVNVAAMDTDGDEIADAIFAVQGPIGTVGEVHRFDITSTSPFAYQQADPLTGFPGPWFIATSKSPASGSDRQVGPIVPPPITVWTNPVNPFDVSNEGLVSPLDVLMGINHINTNPGDTSLPAQQFSPPRFLDTNVDGAITPSDVLLVLNHLSLLADSGEGETDQPAGEVAASFSPWDMAASPAIPRSASSEAEVRSDQLVEALGTASVPGAEWYLPDAEEDSPWVPSSLDTPSDGPDLFDLESILEDIAAEIASL